MNYSELCGFLPPPERLWHLSIDMRAWYRGPQGLDSGDQGNEAYLRGMLTGWNFIIRELLTGEIMSVDKVIDLHDLIMKNPEKHFKNADTRNATFGIDKTTVSAKQQRDEIIAELNQQLQTGEIHFNEETSKLRRSHNEGTSTPVRSREQSSAAFFTNKAIKEDILFVLTNYITLLNKGTSSITNTDEKIRSILDPILKIEFLHPFRDGNARTFLILLFNYYLIKSKINPVQLFDTSYFESYSFNEVLPMIKHGQEKLQRPPNFWELKDHKKCPVLYFSDHSGQPLDYIIQYFSQYYHYTFDAQYPSDSMTLECILSLPKKTNADVRQNNPEEYENPAVFNIDPLFTGVMANTSELYWTVRYDPIFIKLLNENIPMRVWAINCSNFIPALCAIRPDAAGADANTSSLYWILGRNTKADFFTLLNNNPIFKENLLAHPDLIPALCAIRPNAAGADANTSGLYWILGNNTRADFFTLLNNNPTFKDNLLAHPDFIPAFCAIIPDAAGADANTSSLYWILASTSSRTDFFTLLNNNPAFKDNLLAHPDFLLQIMASIQERKLEQAEVNNLLKLSLTLNDNNKWNIVKNLIHLTDNNKPDIEAISDALVNATKANKLEWLLTQDPHFSYKRVKFFKEININERYHLDSLSSILQLLRERNEEDTISQLTTLFPDSSECDAKP